jgi:hypothetical protein
VVGVSGEQYPWRFLRDGRPLLRMCEVWWWMRGGAVSSFVLRRRGLAEST